MYDVVVKKVHVRYLIPWWVSCHYCRAGASRELHGVNMAVEGGALGYYGYRREGLHGSERAPGR